MIMMMMIGGVSAGLPTDCACVLADHFTAALRCKMNCTGDLSQIRGKSYAHLFASHYEYLHISYYLSTYWCVCVFMNGRMQSTRFGLLHS